MLSQFGERRAEAQRRYAEFVAEGRGRPSPSSTVRGQALLGSESFVETMRRFLEEKHKLKEIPCAQRFRLPAAAACGSRAMMKRQNAERVGHLFVQVKTKESGVLVSRSLSFSDRRFLFPY